MEERKFWDVQILSSMVGTIDMVISVFLGVILVQNGYGNLYALSQEEGHTPSRGQTISIITFSIFVILLFFECMMGMVLKIGADHRGLRNCRAWLFYSLVTTITSTFVFLILISMAQFGDTAALILTGLHFVYNVGSLWIVRRYIIRLESGERGALEYQEALTA